MSDEKKGAQTIYYDGSCKACQVFADSTSAHTVPLDVEQGHLPDGVTREQAMTEMYAVDANGQTHVGADAILHVLNLYWYWRPIVWLARLPGLIHVVRAGYRVLAKHRHTLSRTLRS